MYAGSQDGNFYALNAATGTKIWSAPTGDGDTYTNSSPAVVGGVVYVGSTDKNLYAFRSADGSKIWTYPTGAKVSSSPAVFNGVVYFGSEDGSVYAVNAEFGTKVWTRATGGAVYSSAAIANGLVYIGSWGNTIYAFDASTGTTVWSYQTGGGVFSSPTVAGGVMFVGSYDGSIYAFGSTFNPGSSPSTPNSPQPSTPSTSEVTKTAWTPQPVSGVAAGVVAVGALSLGSILAAAASSAPAAATSGFIDRLVGKIRELLPETTKKWLEDLIASKRKIKIDEKTGSPYLPTKSELIVYTISIVISTFTFAYVKVIDLTQFLTVLPTFFATSLIVSLVRTYILVVYTRRKGAWAEYKLWPFGIGLFLLSTLAFRFPFSSPTRTVHHSKNFTARLGGVLSIFALLITLAFAGIFFILLKSGFALVGGAGLAMCLIAAFFDTFPIEPMGGKSIYKFNKLVWLALFLTTLTLYVAWLMHLL